MARDKATKVKVTDAPFRRQDFTGLPDVAVGGGPGGIMTLLGLDGDEGEQGDMGFPGPIGPSGGPIGPPGPPGAAGAAGAAGANGTNGVNGTQGPAGADGDASEHDEWAPLPSPFRETITLLQEQLLTADVASVTFSGIPAIYRHLRLIIHGRLTEAQLDNYLLLQFNGDTGANYDTQQSLAYNNGSSSFAGVSAQTSIRIADMAAANAAANSAGMCEVLIPNYAGTTYFKSLYSGMTTPVNASGALSIVGAFGGNWRSAAAINQLLVKPTANNIKAGSLLSLYAMR